MPWRFGGILAILVTQFLGLGLYQAWHDSFTIDEPFYLVSGVAAVTEADLAINAEHPPLPKVLAALPVVALTDFRLDTESEAFARADQFGLAVESLDTHRGDIREITFLARLVPLLTGAAVGVVLALLGRRLFGPVAGLISGGLWLTLPVVLGFSHLNGLDVPAAGSVVLARYLLDRFLDLPAGASLAVVASRFAAVAVAVGVALLTRSGVGLVVAAAVAVVVAVAAPIPRLWRPLLGVGVR